MPIKDDKKRLTTIVPQDVREELEKEAAKQKRSLSSLVSIILSVFVEKKKEKTEDDK